MSKSEKIIAEIFEPSVDRSQQEACTKPITKALKRNDQVVDYVTFTKSNCPKCVYFHSLLTSLNDRTSICNSEDIGNFIMNLTLPLPVAGSLEISSRRRRYNKKLLKFPWPVGVVQETVAGSTSEGLWLPQMTHIRGKSFYTDTPDEDKKYIFTELIVSSRRHKAFAVIEPSAYSPPTFINLRYNDRFMADEQTNGDKLMLPRMFVRQDGLIDRNKFVNKIRSVLKTHIRNYRKEINSFKCKETEPKVTFSQHGPAITVEVEDETMKQMISTDYVICLPCPEWPRQARSWATRQRNWPDSCVVKKIVHEGCHIVPKPFKAGKLRETEFIFSFSICDRTLSEYLSLTQKRCYMLFKYLFKYCIARISRGLTSYHCKTTFFWVCERTPCVKWKETNVMECISWLLQTLKSYLSEHKLSHYYISDNNLICEMSNASIAACIKDVEKVIESPAKMALVISEHHRLSFLSRDVSLQNILQPLSDKISTTKMLLRGYLLSFWSEILDKGEIGLVVASICQEWASDIVVETNRVVYALEEIITSEAYSDDDGRGQVEENMVCFYGLLANMYHQRACENIEEIGSYGNYMDKCLDTYMKVFDSVGKHIWVYGSCYDCLYQIGWYKELVKHFLSKVNSGCTENTGRLYEPGIYTVITAHNNLTTHPDELAEMLNIVVIPSTAYILHKVALAYLALSKEAKLIQTSRAYKFEASKVLVHLEKWAKRKCELYPEIEDEILHYLVGITARECGNLDVLKSSFNEAVKYGTIFRGFILSDEPQFNAEYAENSGKRYHPYRSKKGSSRQIPADMRFVGSAIRVGPYQHV